jgi:hypothetical protein
MSKLGYSNLPQGGNDQTKIALVDEPNEDGPQDDNIPPTMPMLGQDINPELYTFDEALDTIGFGFYQLVLMFICGSGWMVIVQGFLHSSLMG